MSYFFRGALIGFCIAAPVGPIGVLCIRRSLADGMRIGFATGLGAAVADALYGAVAAFGLTAISDFLSAQQFWLALLGGAFLCYLGIQTFIARPADKTIASKGESATLACASTFLLTITNPATIISFLALFTSFGIASKLLQATVLVLGVFTGSALWWLFLSATVNSVRSRFDLRWMRIVNCVSGSILLGFGIFAFTRMR